MTDHLKKPRPQTVRACHREWETLFQELEERAGDASTKGLFFMIATRIYSAAACAKEPYQPEKGLAFFKRHLDETFAAVRADIEEGRWDPRSGT